jgi:tetratricopeptide (TPR) repeat protein
MAGRHLERRNELVEEHVAQPLEGRDGDGVLEAGPCQKVSSRQELASSYNNLGIVLSHLGRRPRAEDAYNKGLALREQLARDFPAVPAYRVDVGATCLNLGNLQGDSGQTEAALDWYSKGIEAFRAALAADPNDMTARLYLWNAHRGRANALTRLARHGEAAQDWGRALELAAGPARPFLRLQKALALAHAGDHAQADAEADAEADALAEAKDVNAGTLYDLACVYSLSSAAVKSDAKLADRYAARAVELLRQAVAKGWKDIDHLKEDTDLDPLRSRDDYRKLLKELEEKAKARK